MNSRDPCRFCSSAFEPVPFGEEGHFSVLYPLHTLGIYRDCRIVPSSIHPFQLNEQLICGSTHSGSALTFGAIVHIQTALRISVQKF